jgi:hypothetical protein
MRTVMSLFSVWPTRMRPCGGVRRGEKRLALQA